MIQALKFFGELTKVQKQAIHGGGGGWARGFVMCRSPCPLICLDSSFRLRRLMSES